MDEDEEEAAAAEVDEDDEVAWASLGGRRLLRRRLLRRLLLLRGLGDPRAPLAAAAPGASGTTARPSAFSHGPAGGGGRGGYGDPGDAERTPRLLPPRRRGIHSSPQPARPSARASERASEREAARTRGASRRAVLALARRCLLRLAPPRHWVGVFGGAGSSGWRRPHPAPRGGARARARAPGEPVGALPSFPSLPSCPRSPRSRTRPDLPSNPRRGGQSAGPALPSPVALSTATAGPAETPLFRGAAPARRGLPRERALGPLDPQSRGKSGRRPKPASRQPTWPPPRCAAPGFLHDIRKGAVATSGDGPLACGP